MARQQRKTKPEPPLPKDPANPSPQYGRTYPQEHLTRGEIAALLSKLEGSHPIAIRNRALTVLLWRSGLRIAEALALRVIDVDLDELEVRVLRGKGGKARTVAVDPHAGDELRRWLEVRARWSPPAEAPLFCARTGRPLYSTYVRDMLHRTARKAGIERRVHPHIFRHTFAVELAREGTPMHVIQKLLGHSQLSTTATYLSSIAPQEALDVVKRRTW